MHCLHTADSDMDLDRDSGSPFPAPSIISKTRNDGYSSSSDEPNLQKKSSMKNSGGKGGRSRKVKSVAELVRKQEVASQLHNENERVRYVMFTVVCCGAICYSAQLFLVFSLFLPSPKLRIACSKKIHACRKNLH